MIIFGTKGKVVSGDTIQSAPCPNCNHTSYNAFGLLRYFHIFWIPVLVVSRKAGLECQNCKHTLLGKQLDTQLGQQIKRTVFSMKNTLPMFSGLILLVALFVGGYYSAEQTHKQELVFLSQPRIADYYLVNFNKLFKEDSKYKYGVMRVKSVSDDRVELQLSNIGYNKTSGPRSDVRKLEATKDSYYANETVFVSISKLAGLRESRAIYAVLRN